MWLHLFLRLWTQQTDSSDLVLVRHWKQDLIDCQCPRLAPASPVQDWRRQMFVLRSCKSLYRTSSHSYGICQSDTPSPCLMRSHHLQRPGFSTLSGRHWKSFLLCIPTLRYLRALGAITTIWTKDIETSKRCGSLVAILASTQASCYINIG